MTLLLLIHEHLVEWIWFHVKKISKAALNQSAALVVLAQMTEIWTKIFVQHCSRRVTNKNLGRDQFDLRRNYFNQSQNCFEFICVVIGWNVCGTGTGIGKYNRVEARSSWLDIFAQHCSRRDTNKNLGRDQVDLLRNDDITDRARYVSGLLRSINDTTQ